MVEAIANGIEDLLIDSLSFKLPSAARHITDRKSVTFYTSGSNDYSTAGTHVIKIAVNGENWMDPSTLRIAFDVLNTDAAAGALLRPLSGGWSFSAGYVSFAGARLSRTFQSSIVVKNFSPR